MLSNKKTIPILLAAALVLSACSTVKPWQKVYINDAEMELSAKKIEMFETNYETYREGASGANGGKVGGGCGCN
ncbi:MAG: DUF4266 domain-containing protein [Paludibacter sp.]|nr:DUF4266 domain-containing protein [Paludibacter sp.]